MSANKIESLLINTGTEANSGDYTEHTGSDIGTTKRGADTVIYTPGGTGANAQAESRLITFTVDSTPDYSAADQIGDAEEITNAARFSGGGGIIETIAVITDVTQDVGLLFFSDEPTSAADDNSTLNMTSADGDLFLFSVSLSKGRSFSATNVVFSSIQTNLRYQCDSTSLWVVAVALSITNFTATDEFRIRVGMKKD